MKPALETGFFVERFRASNVGAFNTPHSSHPPIAGGPLSRCRHNFFLYYKNFFINTSFCPASSAVCVVCAQLAGLADFCDGAKMSDTTKNFLKVVAENGRLTDLARMYSTLEDQMMASKVSAAQALTRA